MLSIPIGWTYLRTSNLTLSTMLVLAGIWNFMCRTIRWKNITVGWFEGWPPAPPTVFSFQQGRREEGDSAFIRSLPAAGVPYLSSNGDLARQHLHLRPLLISASSILAFGAALPPTPGSASMVSIISILASASPTVSQLDWLPCRLQPYFCLPSMWWACITEALKFYMFLFTSDPLCTTQLDKLPC